MKRSRLSRHLENQTRKSVALFVGGTIIVLYLLVKFGVPLIASATYFLANITQKEITSTKKNGFVAAPTLNDTFSATNSAQISILGTAIAKQKITLYVNDEKVDETDANDDGTFTFGEVRLSQKNNEIKTKATEGKTDSDYSNILSVTMLASAPNLTIDSPSDGQEFHKDDKTTNVSGKTDTGVKVTVNDFWAIVDEQGNYSYSFPLHDGDNEIKIVATDAAGNKTEKTIKVKYSQ